MYFFRLLKPSWGQKFLFVGDKKEKNPEFVEDIKGKNTLEGAFDLDYVAKKNDEGYNIYWFPNHPSKNVYTEEKQYLNGRDIDVFEWVFVDMDLKDGVYKTKEEFFEMLKAFPVKPTMTVVSGHGVHAYWRIEDLNRELYLYVQMMLIQKFKTDDSIWTVLQLMRWPGSVNTKKHGAFKQTEEISDLSSGQSYKISDLAEVLPPIEEKNEAKVKSHLDKLDGKVTVNVGIDVNLDELPDKFITLMETTEDIRELFVEPERVKGDRSKADAALANHLFSRNFNRKEALNVMMNTKKALSKGANRFSYAAGTIDFVYNDRVEHRFKTVGECLKEERQVVRGERARGPSFFDCTKKGWRKTNVMGVIAGSGVGKTSVALKIIKSMIENNPENDDVFVFFSLEMPVHEIHERWVMLCGKGSTLADRLYVIGNEDENGEPRDLTLQDIYDYCQDLRRDTGKNLGCVVIDHKDIINPMIDLKRKPTFGAQAEQMGGKGRERSLSAPTLCKAFKPLAKMLDTFLVVLTQTTKGKGGGDTPIGIDGAFGTAAYEWMMDFVMTIWQPLMRIYKDTDLRVLGWQYAKIRSKHKDDGVVPFEQCSLTYEMDTGDLRPMTDEEKEEFDALLPLANEARKSVDKKESDSYRNSLTSKEIKKLKIYD
jgi:hypothetical protein